MPAPATFNMFSFFSLFFFSTVYVQFISTFGVPPSHLLRTATHGSTQSIHTIYAQYTHNIRTIYTQYTHNIRTIYAQYTHNIRTIYPQYTHNIRTIYAQYTHKIHTYTQYTHNIHTIYTQYTQHLLVFPNKMPYVFTIKNVRILHRMQFATAQCSAAVYKSLATDRRG